MATRLQTVIAHRLDCLTETLEMERLSLRWQSEHVYKSILHFLPVYNFHVGVLQEQCAFNTLLAKKRY